ncbi:glycosyltransferase [Cytobacillus firmus]|uniref:glycosyltransferase n=1 Tax=Cytobacillus firmus TaxID=1399 RepID=UPI00207A7E5E|nr:glycosyltransferase [Cytobacillus firmus]USK38703.1 glycosyltransferase [Cytobacillus firmus]
MRKGTILYIGGFELPDKNAAAHRVLNNGKVLRELGYRVVFIDVDRKLTYETDVLDTKKNVQGFDCWSLAYPKSSKQWIHYLGNVDFLENIVREYDDIKGIICYNYQALAFMKIKKFCKNNNLKILADCTEWYSTKGTNLYFKLIKGLDSFVRMRILQKRLDGIIVISRYLETYYKDCKNIIYIPPLVDHSEEKWNVKVPEYQDDRIHIVYAGSPGRNKDKLHVIIEKLNKLNGNYDFQLNIAGVTKDQYLSNFNRHKEIINKLGEKITFLGRLSHAESLKQVKMAHFTMFIRDDNRMTKAGFPTKFVESISCGTPVITTKNSDLEEYIIPGKNGFFMEFDESNIDMIRKVLSIKKEELRKLKEYSSAQSPFSYVDYIKKMDCFLMKVFES